MFCIDNGRKNKGLKRNIIGYLLVLSLILSNISYLQINAATVTEKADTIYLDGISGNDKNKGTTKEEPVLSISKAKELLAKEGTIQVINKVSVTGEASISYVKIESSLADGIIQVGEKGTLTLEGVTITGKSDTIISNSGTVKLKKNNVFKNNQTIIGESGIKSFGNGKVIKAEDKIANTLSMTCSDITYGETLNPVIAQNEGQGASYLFL
jgi:hypothetical protein